jgi:hypothetical protein
VVVTFPVPATEWGIYLNYRWVLRLGTRDSSGNFVGLQGKNYKLLKVGQAGTTFDFGFHASTAVGQKTAEAVQAWLVNNNKTDQLAQVSCRVRLISSKDRKDYSDLVVSREFLLLENRFALANSPQ